ncbi:MAG: hypothetical protein KKB21_00240, partial [Nanoarchaeota archaeon]|nr:hypothetical protein [Nanoarchaeota archaeon]
KENKIIIVINRPVKEVFEFTTNPKNTHLWILSIQEEFSDEFPPKVGTQYKNRGENSVWDFYKVIEYKPSKIFTLSDLDGNYHVRYTYRKLNNNQTEMEYFEWMKDGELKNPFTQDILENLGSVMEKNR